VKYLLVSGFLTPQVAFAAARAGASEVISKPLSAGDLLFGVSRTLDGPREAAVNGNGVLERAPRLPESVQHSTARRWAKMILAASASATDIVTIDAWAHLIG
jgi:hypothetical protein